jgi:hypothetical protein
MGGTIDVFEALHALLRKPVRFGRKETGKQQIAALYYATKALHTARASQRLIEAGDEYEAWLLLRTLYNLTIDALWVFHTPEGAERFYDATAVGLERHARNYSKLGAELSQETQSKIEANREHFERVKHSFLSAKGKIMPEWAPGSIRDRADALGQIDSRLQFLGETYDDIYARMSDFEHSHPMLFTLYVELDGNRVRAKAKPEVERERGAWLAQVLALLTWLVFDEAGKTLGIPAEKIAEATKGSK